MPRTAIIATALAAATLLAGPSSGLAQGPSTASSRAATIAAIDSIVAANLKTPLNASLQLAVVKGSDTLVMKGYGSANLELDIAATPATVYRTGSVTKQFTSAMIMRLVEGGKLALTDSVGRLFPKAPAHWHRVTLHQLLNHTSGIPSLTDIGPRVRPVMTMGMKRDSIFELLRADSLMFEPGKGFYYNNTGYYLLGMLVEQTSGKKYGEYLLEMVTPLGLTHTTFCAGPALIANRAAGYDRTAAGLVNAGYIEMDMPFAAGSICSTARDLVKWGHALATGKVVSAASYRSMITPVKLAASYDMKYGFALMADTIGGRPVVEHGGNINGFNSQLTLLPRDSLIIAVNTNTSGGTATAVAEAVARVVVGAPRKPVAAKDEPITPAQRARFLGKYSVGEPNGTRREYTVAEQDDHLVLVFPGGAQTQILNWQGGNTFVLKVQPTARIRFDGQGEKVTGVVFDRGVRPLFGTRVN